MMMASEALKPLLSSEWMQINVSDTEIKDVISVPHSDFRISSIGMVFCHLNCLINHCFFLTIMYGQILLFKFFEWYSSYQVHLTTFLRGCYKLHHLALVVKESGLTPKGRRK